MNVQFEHHERKIDPLGSNCVVMSSGNALVANEVISRTRAAVGSAALDFGQAASRLRDEYMSVHVERVDELFYRPRGWTLEEFKKVGNAQVPPQLYIGIDQQVFQYNLGTEFLIAGVDGAGAHVSWVHYHGMQGAGWLETFDKIGYNSVGSGGPHAAISLHFAGQHRDESLARTVFNVFRAKKIAEIAPGVGAQTDVAIVDAAITYLTDAQIAELDELHKKTLPQQISDKDIAEIDKFFQAEGGADAKKR